MGSKTRMKGLAVGSLLLTLWLTGCSGASQATSTAVATPQTTTVATALPQATQVATVPTPQTTPVATTLPQATRVTSVATPSLSVPASPQAPINTPLPAAAEATPVTAATQPPATVAAPSSPTPQEVVPAATAQSNPGLVPTLQSGASTAVSAAANRTVTMADRGKTVELKAEERFVLALGVGFDWNVTVADPAVVAKLPNGTAVQGAQGLYQTYRPGRTKLTAQGDPLCRKNTPPCAAPSVSFETEILVR